MAQYDDLDSEIRVPATGESDELEEAAEGPVEEREGHRRMLAVGWDQASKSSSRLLDDILGTDRFCRVRKLVIDREDDSLPSGPSYVVWRS